MIARRRETLVVIGNGMAGCRVVEEIVARDPDRFTIVLFGEEPGVAYNRMQLSAVLAGARKSTELALRAPEWYTKHGIRQHYGVRVERIDSRERLVVGRPAKRHGQAAIEIAEPYDKLILATGSSPFLPPIEDVKKRGSFVFRTLQDCYAIAEQAQKARRAVVLGGGLLGLEAARGLLEFGCEVTVIEAGPRLMPQQLDADAAAILRRQMEKLGVQSLLGTTAVRLLGEDTVDGLLLADGSILPADLVVISCGIRPNTSLAGEAGIEVRRAIVVDDQLRTSDPYIWAVGECVEHAGRCYGLVEPLYEQARTLADVLTEADPTARYGGSRLSASLKVMGVDLTSMGDVGDVAAGPSTAQVLVHSDAERGIYRKLVMREGKLVGAILLGDATSAAPLLRYFQGDEPLPEPSLESLLAHGVRRSTGQDDDPQICDCNRVPRSEIVQCIRAGCSTIEAIGQACRAGTGCGSCQPKLGQLLKHYSPGGVGRAAPPNKIEILKSQKDGLDSLPEIHRFAETGVWQEMTEDDKQRLKWHGLFFRKQTPGNFMLRVRMTGGQTNARQFRVLADISDQYGKGFCDLTTRQQVQLRWFAIDDVPDIWRRLEEVGLNSKQTGMDNVRGVCGCPAAGITPHELFDATPVAQRFTDSILDSKEFSNLPRKFNVTITACLENCCHSETQDVALVPAYRELNGRQVNGFNVLVGGKQGSGGYTPATGLDVFVAPEDAAELCKRIVEMFRDHGSRESRTRARLCFLIQDQGIGWFRTELENRWGRPLHRAGKDMRKKHHVDHLGIHPQKLPRGYEGPPLHCMGVLVPVGRISTPQMRGLADLAERYGTGDMRLTVQQNILLPNIPEDKLGALTDEPLLKELPFDPSPVMRGLVSCTGSDYCHFALIETKGWAVEVARALEQRLEGRKIAPLTIHWSGCPAGCGLHQVGTIGLQGCRSRVDGKVVDAAHVYVNGKSGPQARTAIDLMYDVPCDKLAEALEPLVSHLPRT